MKTGLAVVAGIMILIGTSVSPATAEPDVTLAALLASSDVVMSEAAVTGAAVEIAARPSEILGGVPGNGNGGTPPGQGGTPPGLGGGTPPGQGGTPPGQGGGGTGGGGTGGGGGNGGGGGGSTGLLLNNEFTTDLTSWTSSNAYAGATSFGSVVPDASSVDGRFAVAHTGVWDGSTYGVIEQGFGVSTSTTATFSVLYNFISTEWNSTSGSQFNDRATVTLSTSTGSIQFQVLESALGSSMFPVTGLPTLINGGRGQDGGQTGWVVGSSGPLVFSTGTYSVKIEVMDAGDAYVDSAILVDRVGLQ